MKPEYVKVTTGMSVITKTGYSLSSRLMLGQSCGCISSSPSAFPGLVGCRKPNFTIMV